MVQCVYFKNDVIDISGFFYKGYEVIFCKLWSVVIKVENIYYNVFFGEMNFFFNSFIESFYN